MREITKKQKQVLEAIEMLSRTCGRAPTLKELQEHLGYASPSSVQRHTEALRKKGALRAEKYSQRNLRVHKAKSNIARVPLLGIVACGEPIFAEENIEAYIPTSVPGDPKDFFCLKAYGTSMNAAGINDGDIILLKKQFTANDGDIVVALIGDDATVKRLRRGTDKIILEPNSNDASHKPIYVFNDDEGFSIQGIFIRKIT